MRVSSIFVAKLLLGNWIFSNFYSYYIIHDGFLVRRHMGGLESRVLEVTCSRRTMIPTMPKNVRLHEIIADVKLSSCPSNLQQHTSNSVLFTTESLDSALKDFWIKSLDKPSLEASINITNR